MSISPPKFFVHILHQESSDLKSTRVDKKSKTNHQHAKYCRDICCSYMLLYFHVRPVYIHSRFYCIYSYIHPCGSPLLRSEQTSRYESLNPRQSYFVLLAKSKSAAIWNCDKTTEKTAILAAPIYFSGHIVPA